MTEGRSVSTALFRISAGPLVWFSHLNTLYALNTFDCLNGIGSSATFTAVATVGAVAVIVGCAWKFWSVGGKGTSVNVGVAVSGLSLLAVLWTALAFASGGTHCA